MTAEAIETGRTLADVKYETLGQLAHRAHELENRGYEILSLNGSIARYYQGPPDQQLMPDLDLLKSLITAKSTDHLRTTTLPDPALINDVFARIEALLEQQA